ncbi:hypothetical protein GCM10010251_14080 [Streptomyces aurantiogriseus]|uniref:Uncharacterized protein n=1 Tax=Streptomyces aurantiogriseus TaxID=66870 RepID=A0A918F300_9ACTN|nr:hypothetical protein GCM10010251_14080 [Streptomyces aurantiogriseus]
MGFHSPRRRSGWPAAWSAAHHHGRSTDGTPLAPQSGVRHRREPVRNGRPNCGRPEGHCPRRPSRPTIRSGAGPRLPVLPAGEDAAESYDAFRAAAAKALPILRLLAPPPPSVPDDIWNRPCAV